MYYVEKYIEMLSRHQFSPSVSRPGPVSTDPSGILNRPSAYDSYRWLLLLEKAPRKYLKFLFLFYKKNVGTKQLEIEDQQINLTTYNHNS